MAGFYPWVSDPIERRIDDALALAGITDAADRPTGTYSGGMRQRLGIAQALIGRPRLLLLDEPASALDPVGRRDVLEIMERLRGDTTIFYSTHILDDVQRVSDHVAILDHGKLVRAAPTQELLRSLSPDRLAVVVRGVTESTAAGLAALPGVASVELESQAANEATYGVETRHGTTEIVQRAITRYAVDNDLALVVGRPGARRSRGRLPSPHRLQGARSMNATTADTLEYVPARQGAGRLLGLRNLVRKDVLDWGHGKRTWIVAAATTTVIVLGAANAAINQWVIASFPAEAGDGPAKILSVVPIDNLLAGIGTQISVLAVIFATMSLLIAERDSGTLAWTISKPVSRTSVLVSKWLTATLVLWVAAFVIPLAITTGLVTVLYGAPDMAVVVAVALATVMVPAIFVGITLVASTFVSNQAAVGAIGLFFFILPSIAGGLVPAVAPFFPTSIFGWAIEVSTGGPISLVTPAAWAIGMTVLFVLGRRRLAGMDL